MKTRDNSIDLAKGIGILLMLAGHISLIWREPYLLLLFKGIYSFHMPLFVALSGYFVDYKKNITPPISAVIKKNAISLVIPYLITGLVCAIASILCFEPEYTMHIVKGLFYSNCGYSKAQFANFTIQGGPIWFLLSLFWCRVIYDCLCRLTPRYIEMWSLILFMLGFIVGRYIITIPLGFGAGLTMLPFYHFGGVLRRHQLYNKRLAWILILWCISIIFSYLNMAQFTYTCFPLSILGALAGTTIIFAFCKRAPVNCVSKMISFFGRNTLAILCCHTIVYHLRKPVMIHFGYIPETCIVDDLVFIGGSIMLAAMYLLFKYVKKQIY